MMAPVYLLLLAVISSVNGLCEDVDCKSVKCPQGYNPFACPSNTFYVDQAALCGCCPGCVQPKGPDESCTGSESAFDLTNFYTEMRYLSTGQAPLVKSEKCAPGLSCKSDTCQAKDEWNCGPKSWENKLKDPTCDYDRSYAAVQCKDPDGQDSPRCFCYDKVGKRIFGWDWIENRANMHCLCSRLVDDMSKNPSQYGDVSIHCSPNGNFEPLQCVRGVCYCADPGTGQPVSSVVPESLWNTLPCYNKTIMGGQYLRLCDSQSNALGILLKELGKHGNNPLAVASTPPCDSDGSFAPKQCSSAGCFCVTKDNTNNIGSYQPFLDSPPSGVCKCARDKIIFRDANKQHLYECNVEGNYKAFQKFGNIGFCVDSDGVINSEAVVIGTPNFCIRLDACRADIPISYC